MQTTTQPKLSRAFIHAIQAIESSYQSIDFNTGDETPLYHDALWTYIDAGRDGGRAEGIAGTELRTFTLIWGFGSPVTGSNGWYGAGEAYGATLSIATSYKDLPAQDLESLISSDGVDLRDALIDLLDPTVPGLGGVEYQGVANADMDDASNVYAHHVFHIVWHAQTSS